MSKNTLRLILMVFHFHVNNAVLLPGLDILSEIIFVVLSTYQNKKKDAHIYKADEFKTFHCVTKTIMKNLKCDPFFLVPFQVLRAGEVFWLYDMIRKISLLGIKIKVSFGAYNFASH